MHTSELRLLRIKRGLTQEQLGQLVGYDRSVVSRWETGAAPVPQDVLVRLADILRAPQLLVDRADPWGDPEPVAAEWLKEEAEEAVEAAERLDSELRHRRLTPGEAEALAEEIYDLYDATTAELAALAREAGVDLERVRERHARKVRERYGVDAGARAA